MQGFPIGPAAEILSFTADKTSIQPGESVTLTWVVVNGDRMVLDHGIGIVPTRGSRTIVPSATITYTLVATGRAGRDKKTVTITVAGTVPVAPDNSSAAAINESVPMAPDGKPDLSGVYIAGFDIRPTGKVTLKPGAEKYNVGMDYGGDLGEHCLPPGVPGATQQPYPMQIIQTPTQVIFLYEAYHLFRVVPLDKPHPSDLDPPGSGIPSATGMAIRWSSMSPHSTTRPLLAFTAIRLRTTWLSAITARPMTKFTTRPPSPTPTCLPSRGPKPER